MAKPKFNFETFKQYMTTMNSLLNSYKKILTELKTLYEAKFDTVQDKSIMQDKKTLQRILESIKTLETLELRTIKNMPHGMANQFATIIEKMITKTEAMQHQLDQMNLAEMYKYIVELIMLESKEEQQLAMVKIK